MKVFIDSNILVSHLIYGHPHNERATAILDRLLDGGDMLVLSLLEQASTPGPKRLGASLETCSNS
ncbi:MAG: hypothetical protein C4523_20515 [Myxococcales bacterium]|nr:MAG: hypothetical protein C4523_20515 [Myxococcales bacterium]